MGKEILAFGNIEIKKMNFTTIRLLFSWGILLLSNKISFG